MKPITNEDIKVLGRIVNISTENVVADASQVWDSEQKKDQETINDSLINKTDNATTSKYGIVRLAVNASDPDNNDVVTVKTMRDAISEAVDALLAGEMTLDTFRELAEALNNDPNFYTWVTNQLALKADKSALDALTGRVSTLESDVAYLKACCAEVQEYMQHFSITWHQAKGGSHVRISPTNIKFGSNTVLFNIDDGYYLGEAISTSNVEGNYATVSCTESNGTYTLILTGVEGNVVINAPIRKEFTVTFVGDGHDTSSNTSTKTVKGKYNTTITAATNYYLNMNTLHAAYATSAQEYTSQIYSFSVSASSVDYSSDSPSIVATAATVNLSNVNGDILLSCETKPLKRTVTVNLTGDGGATFSGATGQLNRGTSYSGTITVPSTSVLNSVSVRKYNTPPNNPAGNGYWTDVTSTCYNSSTKQVNISNLTDDITIAISSSALGTGPTPPDPTTNGSVTLVVNNGTANPSTGYLDGEFSSVITPNTGYTLTGAQITSTDSFIEPELENGVLTISQIGLDNITVTVTLQPSSTPVTYGTVAVSPDHGTASPASFSADGTSHTITITPASGYTTTGMTATTTNNDLTVSVSGNTITVTGTSSNNATINVTVPAESTPTPGGPATVNVVVNQYNGYGGNASPASGTATNGTFESTVTFYQSDDYRPANTFVVLTDHNGNVVAQSLPGNTTTADPSATSPDLGYMYSTGYYATLTLTGLADGEAYTANVYFIGGMDSVTFDAYGRTNDYANGRKGTLNYGGSAYQSSAGDYSTQNPFTAGYSYGEIMLPDITTLNVPGSTNQEKLANLANSLVFDFYKLDNNGTDARELGPNPYIPFSISGDSSTTQNTYVSNTNNYNIRLNGTIPVIDVVCAPFTSTTPSTDTYDTDTDGYAVIESDPIFFDNNYGTDVHWAGTTGGSRQYIADSCWTNLVYITSTLDSSIQLRVRLFRKGYAIREIDIVTSTSSGSSMQYCVYAAPLSAIDHYTYTVVDDSSNTTIDSGTGGTTGSIDVSTHPTITVTFVAIPKSTALTENLVSTMSYDYSGS